MSFMPQLCNVCKYTGYRFRSNIQHRRWFAAEMGTPEAIDRLKKKDSIDAKFRLIYKPPESAMLMTATSFCAFSSIISPGFIGSYAYDRFFGRNLELVEEVSNLQLLGIGSVTVFSMAALYFCTTIPMRIYNHEKEYVAILPHLIPTITKKFYFKKGDIKDKNRSIWITKVFSYIGKFSKDTAHEQIAMYKINDKRIFITSKCFEKPIQFFEMFANTEKYVRKLKHKPIE